MLVRRTYLAFHLMVGIGGARKTDRVHKARSEIVDIVKGAIRYSKVVNAARFVVISRGQVGECGTQAALSKMSIGLWHALTSLVLFQRREASR